MAVSLASLLPGLHPGFGRESFFPCIYREKRHPIKYAFLDAAYVDLWGEEDRVFPIALANRWIGRFGLNTLDLRDNGSLLSLPNLNRCLCHPTYCSHLGDNAQLMIIKPAGHAVNLEKPKAEISSP
ncbi:hypothetical protein Ancab_007225 [Ancistrocladus abbreviatus]